MKKFIFMTLGLFLIHSIHATDHEILYATLQHSPIERMLRSSKHSIKTKNNLFPVFIDHKEAYEKQLEKQLEEYWNTPEGKALLELVERNKKIREQKNKMINYCVSTLFFAGSVIARRLIQKN